MKSVDAVYWVEQARQGSVAAFERLYRAYAGRIYGLCLRMTASRAEAEDCTQNAFVSAWQRLDQFEGRSDVGTWLHRIAVNEVLMAHRRHGPTDEIPADHGAASGAAAGPELAIDLEAAIAALPEQARHVFVLRAVYGHSHREIAALMDLAAGTVRAHFHRARELLGERLDPEISND